MTPPLLEVVVVSCRTCGRLVGTPFLREHVVSCIDGGTAVDVVDRPCSPAFNGGRSCEPCTRSGKNRGVWPPLLWNVRVGLPVHDYAGRPLDATPPSGEGTGGRASSHGGESSPPGGS